ncbi:hypothetical protein SynRS9909_00237 [Synechococcus sp. RS9909]|uniref:hypothetical protein n=1 Tax=unclassified Synechococcus TaxID=2626047 RepID=UPI0003236BB9|nr:MULTISPECIES: hypothetical protein [unclassified Synechococcus]QNI78252.1 hypothetical protein SynRS9909_00237 [Synechococcus sp. RS9909]
MIIADFCSTGISHREFNTAFVYYLHKTHSIRTCFLESTHISQILRDPLYQSSPFKVISFSQNPSLASQFLNVLRVFFHARNVASPVYILNISPFLLPFCRLLASFFLLEVSFLAHSLYDDLAKLSSNNFNLRDITYKSILFLIPYKHFKVIFIGIHTSQNIPQLKLPSNSWQVLPFPFADYSSRIPTLFVSKHSSFDRVPFLVGCPGFNSSAYLNNRKFIVNSISTSSKVLADNCIIIPFGGYNLKHPTTKSASINSLLESLPSDYHELFNSCQLILFPSRISHQYTYSFSASFADAIAHGKPLILKPNILTNYYEERFGPFYISLSDISGKISSFSLPSVSKLDLMKSNILDLKSYLISQSSPK